MDESSKTIKELIELLKLNGVSVKYSHWENPDNGNWNYEVDGLDFSEHDKQFHREIERSKFEIARSKKEVDRIKKLNEEYCDENVSLNRENKELRKQLEEIDIIGNLPYEPIEVAQMLITATHTYETNGLQMALGKGEKDSYNIYDISDLCQIAEHLLVYCNNNQYGE